MSTAAPDVPTSSSLHDEHVDSSPRLQDAAAESDDAHTSDHDTSASFLGTGGGSEAEKHPKGRRKRTGAQDKSMLEQAYINNAKPDKQARLAIVERVSLNEKEVQIWFQNRRQNDRRKSRPLTAQEIAALRPGGLHIGSDPTSRASFSYCSESFPSSDPAAHDASDHLFNLSSSQGSPPASKDPNEASLATPLQGSQESAGKTLGPSSQESPSSGPLPSSCPSSVGYLANRWNLGSSFSANSTPGRDLDLIPGADKDGSGNTQVLSLPILKALIPSGDTADTPHATDEGRRGHMRLSMSLEGKAELIRDSPRRLAAPPPSADILPPPLFGPRARVLQRSQSALVGVKLPPISSVTAALPKPTPSMIRGRSSDVRAWESCAGPEVHDDLTERAEAEASGSAALEIALARSRAGSLGLGVQRSGSKRGSAAPSSTHLTAAKKTKLNRTLSSVGRLESQASGVDKYREESKGKMRVSMLCADTDSDKENWHPDSSGHPAPPHGRRPLPAGPARAADPAQEEARRRRRAVGRNGSRAPAWLSGRAKTAPAGLADKENSQPPGQEAGDADVQSFMRGEVSPGKERDWHCVQGLLSLSGSQWDHPR